MRKVCVFLGVLVSAGIILAADSTTAVAKSPAAETPAAATPAESASTVVVTTTDSAAPSASVNAAEPAKKTVCNSTDKKCCKAKPCCMVGMAGKTPSWFTPYGMAQLRLREDIVSNKAKNGVDSLGATFQYMLGYKIGAKICPNDQALLQFELGNDWYATDIATGIPGNYQKNRDPLTPWFSLAFAQWDPGYLHIQAGIIPVRGTPMMDLLGVSILYNKKYSYASQLCWANITNGGQTGLRLGAPILKDNFKLGVDLMGAIVQQRSVIMGANAWNYNADGLEFEGEIPFSVMGISVTPQTFAIIDRSFNTATNKGDMEYGAGIDAVYKCCDAACVRAGLGYAQNSNDNSFAPGQRTLKNPLNPTDTSTTVVTPSERSGINVNLGTSVSVGPGKLDLDLNYSTDHDAKDTTVDDGYSYLDLKYGWAVNKNFVIKPRIRFYIVNPKTVYDSKLTTRPELILEGSF